MNIKETEDKAMARIIAMDEMGNFETRDKGVRLIGGYVIEDNYHEEKKEMEKFFQELCDKYTKKIQQKHKEYNIIYPKSLHGSGSLFFKSNIKEGKQSWVMVDKDENKKVQNDIWEEMQTEAMEYLKRKNCRLFMYLDPHTGGGYDENTCSSSNITDEQQVANRYERMALQAIYHQIFYSVHSDADKYVFEIATRTLVPNEKNPKYSKGDYDKVYQENNGRIYLTNTSTFKTAISTMLYEKQINTEAIYEFNVEPINYDKADEKDTTPYTYMADIVCSYMRKLFSKGLKINAETKENLVSSSNLIEMVKANVEVGLEIFVYSKSDVLYRKMVEAAKNHNVVDYYAYLYELLELDGEPEEEEDVQGCMSLEPKDISTKSYKKFYIENWIPSLNSYLMDKIETDAAGKRIFRSRIDDYVSYIEGYMGSREISYEKGLFIAGKLIAHVEGQEGWKKRSAILFKLYDIKLRAYNHRGSIDDVKECARNCNLYKAYVNTEQYVAHILRVIEYYMNSFRFEEALKVSLSLKEVGDKLEETYTEAYAASEKIAASILGDVNPVQSGQLSIVGKIYSNLGQVYAFLNDYYNSKEMFEVALQKFSSDTDDYKITHSYYLHLLIENDKLLEYNKESTLYFGTDDIKQQLKNAVQYNAYALFIFVKALKKLYISDYLSREVLEETIAEINKIDSSRRTGHPWELIYKNISESLLMIARTDNANKERYEELADKYAARCQACNQNADTTIDLIQINAKLEFMKMKDMIEEDGVVENLDPKEIRSCEKILDCKAPIRYKQLKEFLDDKITYMYR